MQISSSTLLRIMVSPTDSLNEQGNETSAEPYAKLYADPSNGDSSEPNLTEIIYTLDILLADEGWMAASTAQVVLDISEEIGDVAGGLPNKQFTDLCVRFRDVAMAVLWLAVAPSMSATIAMIPPCEIEVPADSVDFEFLVPSAEQQDLEGTE